MSVSPLVHKYCLIHAGHENSLKNNTFKIIFCFHHTDLCRNVTHFIIMAHLSLSRITDMLFTMGIGPSFCTSEHYKRKIQLEQCSWETNPMVIQFRFRILKYKEILKYLSEYALFWDRIHRCIRPIVSIGLVPFYSGLFISLNLLGC